MSVYSRYYENEINFKAELHAMTNPLLKVRPKHYISGSEFDVIDIAKAYKLNFNRGNIVKYICRAGKKEDELKDLKKALDYLQREIKSLEL